MSGKAKVTKTVGVDSGIVVSSRRKRHSLHFRVGAIVVSCLALLAVIIGVVVLLKDHYSTSPTTQSNNQISENTYSGAVPTASAEAYAAVTSAEDQADNGDYQGAQTKLDTAISAAGNNKASQGILYEGKAMLAENAEQYTDALQFARQAEALNPTANSALIIARVSETTGDKATAASYYTKTAERTTGYDKQDYIDKATELSK